MKSVPLCTYVAYRYSQEGYTVWYYTESAIHPEHNKKIVASLTKSPGSRITSRFLPLSPHSPSPVSPFHPHPSPFPPPPLLPPSLPLFIHLSLTDSFSGVHTPSHALNALRLVKSQSEIALMRKAGEIAATAFREVQ